MKASLSSVSMVVLLGLVGVLLLRVTELNHARSEAQSELAETKETVRDLRTILSGYQLEFKESDLAQQIVKLPTLPLSLDGNPSRAALDETHKMLMKDIYDRATRLEPAKHGMTLPLKHTKNESPRSFRTVPAEYPGVNWHSFGLY